MKMNLQVAILAVTLPFALFAAKTAAPHLPIGGLPNTEVATNLILRIDAAKTERLVFTIEAVNSPSNSLAVAVRRDDPIAPQAGESGGMGSCRPTKLFKAVYAAGCNMGIGHETNGGVTTLEIAASELPPGKMLKIAACPLSSLGTFGRAIATMFKV